MSDNIYTLVGTRDVSFKGSDGNQVEGVNLFFTFEDTHIRGVGVEKVFVPSKRFMQLSYVPEIGSTCELFYNKYGKVSDIGRV